MIPTNRGPLSPMRAADLVTYINYACNRDARPDIPPERYAKAGYPDVPAMEARYQAEKAIAKAKASL